MQQQYMVAFCDILGFSRLVESKPLNEVVKHFYGRVQKSLHHSLHKRDFPAEIPRKSDFLGNHHVGVAWFSDTIILYTRRSEKETIQQLIQTVGWLLFETMMAGTWIRGGISFGEAYIDEENSVFVGKPIVEAYQLEKKQQWAGVALAKSAYDRIPEDARTGYSADWWVIPYDVPLKEKKTLRTLAINWTWGEHSRWPFGSKESLDDCDWMTRPDVYEKSINTKAFHLAVCQNCNRD